MNEELIETGTEPPRGGSPHMTQALHLLTGVVLPGILLTTVVWYLYSLQYHPSASAVIAIVIALTSVTVSVAVYAVWLQIKRIQVWSPVWAIISAAYCTWVAFAVWLLLPESDFYDSDVLLFACALAMIPILYSMIQVVLWLTPDNKSHSIGKPLLSLLAMPILWYIFVNGGLFSFDEAYTSILLLVAVTATYGFIFLLLRTLYLLARTHNGAWPVIRIVIIFVLPLLGLIVSQIDPFRYVFWDFSSPVYYLLVIVNGSLLLIPEPEKSAFRLLLLFARGITYLFVVYFFICLSPFYALSLLGIIAYGAGILVLAPLFLFLYQTRLLAASLKRLHVTYGLAKPVSIFVLGTLMLPACLILSFMGDKANVGKAMSYINASANANAGAVNISALEQSLDYMTGGWEQGRTPPPIISGLYNKIVSGNKVLSDSAYLRARVLFFDDKNSADELSFSTGFSPGSPEVVVSDARVETQRDGDEYRSFVHLTLENTGVRDRAEYASRFRLPDGVFISNYYLDVLGERKYGLLSAKQSALWIYNRVVSQARDPGILYFDGDDIVFRVFPFSGGEVRYTGIEFLHKEPVLLEIDGYTLELAPEAAEITQPVDSGNGAFYVSAACKRSLAPADRAPCYAFVIDCSKDSDVPALLARLNAFCEEYQISGERAVVTALNYRQESFPMTGDWETSVRNFSVEGGFGLSFVADVIYRDNSDENVYPVMIVLSDDIENALLPEDTAYMSAVCPELDGFYVLENDAFELFPFDKSMPESAASGLLEPHPVLALNVDGNVIHMRDDGLPQIAFEKRQNVNHQNELDSGAWATALRLAADYEKVRFLDEKEKTSVSLDLVKDSFRSGIMTPLTSYIVLETAEQEAALKAKQKQILASGNFESSEGEPVRMSEPSLLVCLAIALPAVWVIRRRKNRAA